VTASGPILLLVEDDQAARQALAAYLDRRGYRVDEAGSAHEAFRAWDRRRADLVVLDLGLPDLDGVQVVRRIRREGSTPIIILSGRDDERDKVDALDAGADDYLTKPFGIGELLARIRVALRHSRRDAQARDRPYELAGLHIDVARRRVQRNARDLHLMDDVEARAAGIEAGFASPIGLSGVYVLADDQLPLLVFGGLSLIVAGVEIELAGTRVRLPRPAGMLTGPAPQTTPSRAARAARRPP
jgi:CheY-like chemotaxis protein